MNEEQFFSTIRPFFPGKRLNQSQVNGLKLILAETQSIPFDSRAYMLATAAHETAFTMQPVRETLASTDDEAIRRLESSWRAGKLSWVKTPYWRKDADGKSWFGRGLVQITHKVNYAKMSPLVGADLVANPGLALNPTIAIKIMVEGMRRGVFTGQALDDYFDRVDESDAEDLREFIAARRIINGTDRAKKIGDLALVFEKAMKV